MQFFSLRIITYGLLISLYGAHFDNKKFAQDFSIKFTALVFCEKRIVSSS